MIKKLAILGFSIILSFQLITAEDVQRSRPEGWEKLVQGGRFMDRFLPMPKTGELTSDTWGLEGVKPRYIDNGIEDQEWSYWGGNILIDENGVHHLFVCRWREDDPKGHMAWSRSEVVHAVCNNSIGPYKVVDIIGPGHNPEIQPLKDGGYFLYASEHFKMTYYYADSLDGPWEIRDMAYDSRQRQIVDHMANNTFAQREDGSMLMVGRGGGIWISKSGLPPYKQITAETVYPPFDGRYEDPVVWKTNIQYHLIVNDWLGRIAYYMRSKDGVHWKLDAGEAYLPGIARHEDGRVEDWYKFERIKVLQDQFGRAYQANFAVNDTVKRQDLGSDIHSSKNISVPLTVGRLIEIVNHEKIDENTQEIELLIKGEPGFNPHVDVDLDSLRFGASEVVDFGRGCQVSNIEIHGNDLLVTFLGIGNGLTDNNFAAKLLGKTTAGDLLFGYARLPWIEYEVPILSSKFPELTVHGKKLNIDVEIENFGVVKSTQATLKIEFLDNGTWKTIGQAVVPEMNPYEAVNLKVFGTETMKRNEAINIRSTITQEVLDPVILEGPVVIR